MVPGSTDTFYNKKFYYKNHEAPYPDYFRDITPEKKKKSIGLGVPFRESI